VQVDVLTCLRLMVFNRLCDPGSKRGVLRWLETVALPADFGLNPEHQHLLRATDVLDEYSKTSRLCFMTSPPSPSQVKPTWTMMCAPTAWPSQG
jgi:hypothetical protein